MSLLSKGQGRVNCGGSRGNLARTTRIVIRLYRETAFLGCRLGFRLARRAP